MTRDMERHGDAASPLARLLRMRSASAPAWGLAAAGLALATAARVALDGLAPGIAPFLFFFPVVLLAALAGGFWLGLASTAGAAAISWYALLSPRMSPELELGSAVTLLGFVLASLLIAGVAARLRAAERGLRRLNTELEMRVMERTRALEEEARRREAAEERARQSQRLEAIGQLTGGVAHDFNNLLTVVIGSLGVLGRSLAPGAEAADPARLRRLADAALEAARRGAVLNRRLLAFARRQALQPATVDANALIAGMSDVIRRALGERVEVETVLAGGLWPTLADPTELEAALLNLAVNARDAMPDGGRLTLETANARLDDAYAATHAEVMPGQYVLLAVSDTGAGMPPEVVARAFDPFFTTKGIGRGTGLGLSQVYGFVKQSGGHVKIYSELGRGTTVKIYLPRLLPAEAAAMLPSATAAPMDIPAPRARPGEAILLVEDDPAVRAFAAEALGGLGYRVVEAGEGRTALAALATEPELALLLTDVGLPNGMTGRQLADAVHRLRPALPVLYSTAYAPNAIVHGGVLDPGTRLLPKPFTAEELAVKVRQAIDAAP
jgi:signal transduction histidine kinase/CheY-like chemotaxis protein